ncbi:MAG: T9SS type A sorting domain-containing protein [Ferruginibacter sp.]|nr:T9SS type A sorting domain-containing protein [Ferruginibacter sp.]
MKKLFTLFYFAIFTVTLMAQPPLMNINQDVSGTYANNDAPLRGPVFVKRFQENATGTASGTRNWQFNSDTYNNTWGVLGTNAATSVTLAGYNQIINPSASTASANWKNVGYNSKGRLPATTANYYYTYIIAKGSSYADQKMSVLETSFNPVTIPTVTRTPSGTPTGGTVSAGNPVVINITLSSTPNASEAIYVRYSVDNFASSTLAQATGSGTTWSASIPAQTSGTTVTYYVLTASSSPLFAPVDSDFFTLEFNNNSNSNYSYSTIAALSVETVNIEARKINQTTNLLWQTAAEKDNALFKIERSANAKEFSTIGEVNGSGNSTAIKNYTFTDVAPLSGVNYYRLKTVDYTGAATFSKVVSVKFSGKTDGIVAVYPNPTIDMLRLDVRAAAPARTLIQITDINGRIVLSQNATVVKGLNLLTLNVAALNPGTYMVKVNGDINQFVKQ